MNFFKHWICGSFLTLVMSCGGGGGSTNALPAPSSPPQILSFTVDPAYIALGQMGTLRWTTSGANDVSIDQGIGSVSASSSKEIAPLVTTTYTLQARNSAGTVTSALTVPVLTGAPLINSFVATPGNVVLGQSTVLSWEVFGATSLRIQGLGTVTGTSVTVTPTAPCSFTLIATGDRGTSQKTITVGIVSPPPVIASFQAVPSDIRAGESSVLKWNVTGAMNLQLDQNLGNVSGTSRSVTPSQTTTYTLTATGPDFTQVSKTATVNVKPMPTLTSTAPKQAAWGSPILFDATASEPVGEFKLLYGPAGMTCTSQGQVSWTPSHPMFGPSLDVHWCITTSAFPSAKLEGTLTITDAARLMPLRRTGLEIAARNQAFQVTDLDGDGKLEILAGSRNGLEELVWDGAGLVQRWVLPWAEQDSIDILAVVAKDLNADGKQEIFYASGQALTKLDGGTRQVVGRFPADKGCYFFDLICTDVDGDGKQEIIALEGDNLYFESKGHVIVLDAMTLTEKWRTAELHLGKSMGAGQVDREPGLEIVTSGGYVFDGKSGANKWAYSSPFGDMVVVADMDGDGTAEIVGMESWSVIKGYSAVLKIPLWEFQDFNFDAIMTTDINKDGLADLVVGDAQWGNIRGLTYDKTKNQLTELWRQDSLGGGVCGLSVADIDGDGKAELIWGTGGSSTGEDYWVIASLTPKPAIKWQNEKPSQLDGPFAGARLVKTVGRPDRLVFVTPSTDSGYAGMRLISMDPLTGSISWSSEFGSNWAHNAAMDVADVDGDGSEELLVGTADYDDSYFIACDSSSLAQTWRSPSNNSDTVAAITHADFTGDGIPDLVGITGQGYIYVFDIKNQIQIWKSTSLGSGSDIAVADLDGDGTPEIVASANGHLYIYRRTTDPVAFVEKHSVAIPGASNLAIDSLNGVLSINVLTDDYISHIIRLNNKLITIGDIALDLNNGHKATSLYLEESETGAHNLLIGIMSSGVSPSSMMKAINPVNGEVIWSSPWFAGSLPPHSLTFLKSSSGRPEIAFGTSQGMFLTR